MKKLYSVTNFSQGVNELHGQGASELVNFDIRSDGALVTRNGFVGVDTLGGGIVASGAGDISQIFFANGFLLAQTTNGLYYRSGDDAFTAVTNSTGLPDSGSAGSDLATACGSAFSVVVANSDRVFLANTAANGRFWIDTSPSTPVLYKWGIDAPDLSAMTPTFTSGLGGLGEGEYAYAFAYEGLFGAMSPLTARSIQTAGSNGTYSWAFPSASALDAQIQKVIIYRTEKVSVVTYDEARDYEKVNAANAPLKRVGELARASMGSSSFNDNVKVPSIGLAPLAGQLEGADKPPNLLANITLYGGRIWGCVNGTDELVFSALDETAAPLYDIFPGETAAIPHIVKTRDKITAIASSREYLAAFSETSVQLVKGQGIISGLYGKQQPGTDLDLSQRLNMMGCNSQRLVDTFNDNIYFYSQNESRVYRMDMSAQISWIGQPVEKLIDDMESESGSQFSDLVADRGAIYLLRYFTSGSKAEMADILRYDEFKNQWTSHDLGANAIRRITANLAGLDSAGVSNNYSQGLFGIATIGSADQVVQLFKDSQTDDGGDPIVTSYTSRVFSFAKPSRLDMIRIGTVGNATTTVYLYTDSDNVTKQINSPAEDEYALNGNNNYTVRTFARGYKHQVKFQLTGAQTVRFFELQFRSR